MRRRSRARCILKWTGAVLCVLILCAAASTLQWMSFGMMHGVHDGVILAGGALCFVGEMDASLEWSGPPPTGWRFRAIRFGRASTREWWAMFAAKPGTGFPNYPTALTIPLWMPFVAVAIPTGVLWYRDRRRAGPGQCAKCGYNLTGNTSGRCPECGEAFEPDGPPQ